MKLAVLTLLLFASVNSFAVVQNVQISGSVSKVVGQPINTVWGVMAGTADTSETAAYDSCALALPDDTFTGCHENRVNGNHEIVLQFTETEEVLQKAPVAYVEVLVAGGGDTTGGNNNIRIGVRNEQAVRTGANQVGVLEFSWADLCGLLKDGNNNSGVINTSVDGVQRCEIDGAPASGTILVTFGFETNVNIIQAQNRGQMTFNLYSPSEDSYLADPSCSSSDTSTKYGFCDIGVFPGDSGGTMRAIEGFDRTTKLVSGTSATVQNLRDPFGNNSPQGFNLSVEQLRLYFSSINFASAHPSVAGDDQIVDLFLETNNNGETVVFREPNFGGLQNGTPYIFRAATIDSSGYVSHIMRRANADNTEGVYCPGPPGETTPVTCPKYSITPSEIAGLITESSCFITSATYGSPQASQVIIFREFRAKYLWTNSLGRVISNTYNKYGPIGAKWIYQNPSSKKMVRFALYPFYGFAFLSVHYGLGSAMIIYLLGLVVLTLGFYKAFSKVKYTK